MASILRPLRQPRSSPHPSLATLAFGYLLLGLAILSQPGCTLAKPGQPTSPARFSQPYPSRPPPLLVQPARQTTVSDWRRETHSPAPANGHLLEPKLVPVALGVMSKCPDAQICEDVFDKVLAEVSGKTDLLAVYMGDIDPSAKYGARCRHGEPECRANIQQLCYRNRFPALHDWWGFIQCENYAGLARVGDEMLARSCAKVSKHDWDADVKSCADGDEGEQLLQSSIRLAKQMNIQKSCSIYINHRLVCVHDGSWKDCPAGNQVSDFVKIIEQEFELINTPPS